MLNDFSKLNGIKLLKKEDQKSINGSSSGCPTECITDSNCCPGKICVGCICTYPGGPY
ncbi:hypothetical protein [Aquimarina sp. BL5]|uniref:hypothetical protein n=1 Tax=Aquimarina sp. BL5 TaxID=1714860 RepID=UPI001314A97C|nr:hypothetical protein [Aquimarina sp. BL5]